MRVRIYPYVEPHMKTIASVDYPKTFFDIVSDAMEITVEGPVQSRLVFEQDRIIVEHGNAYTVCTDADRQR